MITKRAGLSISLFLTIFVISGCVTMEGSWDDAKRNNSKWSYESFIRKYPQSPHVDEARNAIRELDWKVANQQQTKYSYGHFIEKYGSGPHVEEARLKIAELKEIAELKDYQHAIKADYITVLENFLSRYPESSKRAEIISRIETLKIKEEDQLYNKAINSDSDELMAEYIKKHPTGRYYNQIKRKQDSFTWVTLEAPKVLSWQQLTCSLWSSDSFQAFIKNEQFPFKMTGCIKGSTIVATTSLYFVKEGTTVQDTPIKPSHPTVGPVKSDASNKISPSLLYAVYEFTAPPGDCLPVVNMNKYVLAVGSTMTIPPTDAYFVSLCGYKIHSGSVKVVSSGFELQKGSSIWMTR